MQGNEIDTLNQGNSDWIDVDNGGPMDDEVEVSGEGEEIHILLERSGVQVFVSLAIGCVWAN